MYSALIIEIILCILGFALPKSKTITFLLIAFMWVYYGLNTYSGDYKAYESVYHMIQTGGLKFYFEPFFSVLMFVSAKLGLSFIGFKCILATVFLFLLILVVNRYTDRIAMAIALFAVFPFGTFSSVLRAGVAGLIIVYNLKYLKFQPKKYVFGILLACLFHYSSAFYLIFLLSRSEMTLKRKLIIAVFPIMLTLIYYTNVFYIIGSRITSNPKVLIWLQSETANNNLNIKGVLSQVVVLLLIVFLARWNNKVSKHYSDVAIIDQNRFEFQKTVYKCTMWMIVIIPLFFVTSVWLRFLWEIMLAEIIATVNSISLIKRRQNAIPLLFCFMLVLLLLLNYYTGMPYIGTENAEINMYRNNLVFQLFPF